MAHNFFISVEAARRGIIRHVKNSSTVDVAVKNAAGHILAETIRSPADSPPFHQSAMDGYALRYEDVKSGTDLNIIGQVGAGTQFNGKMLNGQAVQIFTGAPVPHGADTVVMQEKTRITGNRLVIADDLIKKSDNIRKAGSQIRKGAIAARKGTVITPGAAGFIASLGIRSVKVFRKPRIAIIITGNELILPGKKLSGGKIYESNSVSLQALLHADGIKEISVVNVKDHYETTRKEFLKALKRNDFVIFTGGVSVGEFDYVGQLMHKEKVKTIFYKVKQKPGKPLFFGMHKGNYVFGLPGNPAAVVTCYYEFVRMAIRKFQNFQNPFPVSLQLPLHAGISKKPGLTTYMKAFTDFKTVTVLPGQESYILKSFTEANCFVVLDEKDDFKKAGETVEVHLV